MTRALSMMCAGIALSFTGCAGGEQPESFARDAALDDAQLTSAAGASESHESGANCMECHSAASDSVATAGPGLFSVGVSLWTGSVESLSPLAGASVQLRTEPFGAGEVIAEYFSDDLGNAYTTDEIDFYAGALFPHVVHPNGEASLSMPFPTESGACNMCHHPGGIELLLP